jgi:hypothetical protein
MNIGLFLFLGVISRFLPHAPNFTPIGALALHSSKKKIYTGLLLALAIMAISDIFLGFSFASPFVYLGMASYALWGRYIDRRFGVIYAPILGSISFFIISNFGVWLGPWYEHSLAGLVKCYVLALPFFQNTLLSDLSFTILIFAFLKIIVKIKQGGKIWQLNYLLGISKKK